MHMKNFFFLGLLTLLLFYTGGCNLKKGSDESPNIVWITCEDIGPMLGCYGDTVARTPNLDQLATDGTKYTKAYATAPVCSPSRSCIITGVHATSLGSQHLRSEVTIPGEIIPFPKYLREVGYYCTNNDKEDYNFTDTTIWNESGKEAHWRNREGNQSFFSVFNLGMTHQSQIFGTDRQFEDRYGYKLSQEERCQPDSIVLPPYYPDSPVIRKLWARYYDLVTIMDNEVGNLLHQLKEDGLEDNTIVFFYSDHGIGLPRGKRALYDFGIKVPLLINIPEKFREGWGETGGAINSDLVSFTDFAPSLLSLVGIDIPGYMQGTSLFTENTSEATEYIFATSDRVDEGFELSRAVISKKYKYIRNYMPHLPLLQPNFYTDQSEIMQELNRISENSKLNKTRQTMFQKKRMPEELYDLEKDPHEVYNLAADAKYLAVLLKMRTAHTNWVLKTFDTGFMPEEMMHSLSWHSTPYEMARDTGLYPLRRIVEAANLMLDPGKLDAKLPEYLDDSNHFVVYWALNNLLSFPKKAPWYLTEIQDLLHHENANIRILSADLICRAGKPGQGLPVLLQELRNKDEMIMLYAARTYQLLGQIADPIKAAVDQIRKELNKKVNNKWYGYDLYASWALNEAFKIK